jgi:hypothetical protein
MEQDQPARRRIVVDGSNIATEGRSLPSLAQLDEAIRSFLEEYHGFTTSDVTVVVDASFGHRIDPSEVTTFEQAVEHGEMITPPAGAVGRGDGFILRIAEKSGALVLSNDSFQEFHAERPWLFEPGRLIGGKPVPGVGWIFTPRTPVRGAKSRSVTSRSKRDGRVSEGELPGTVLDGDGGVAGVDTDGARPVRATRATKTTRATRATRATKATKAGSGATAAEAPAATKDPKAAKATRAAKAAKSVKATKASKAVNARSVPGAEPVEAATAAKAAKPAKAAKTTKAAKAAKSAGEGRAGASARTHADGDQPDQSARPTKAGTATKAAKAASGATKARSGGGRADNPGDDRTGRAPDALNDPMTFLRFVADHPVGSTFDGTVVSFTSHGAHVDVGGMLCHVPLRGLADPPPNKARQVLTKGETRQFALISLDAARRRAELALPGVNG